MESFTDQEIEFKRIRLHIIRLFTAVVLISIYTSVTLFLLKGGTETKDITKGVIRLGFYLLIMYNILQGKNWAKNLYLILLVVGIALGIGLFVANPSWNLGIYTGVIIYVYVRNVIYIGGNSDFDKYFKHLRRTV